MSTKLPSLIAMAAVLACAIDGAEPGPVILVLGPPGSGKTVNAQRISKRYRIPSINLADLLKQSAGWGTAGSRKTMRANVESGDLVSDEVAIGLLEQRLAKADANRGFILDGFPMTVKQAEYLDGVIRQRGLGQVVVLHLTVTDSTATERLLKRDRANDKPEIIQSRLAEYRAGSDLVLKRYKQVITVDAMGPLDEVGRKVEQGLGTVLPASAR